MPVVLLRYSIICELEVMGDRKRGRAAHPRPIFATRYNAFRDRVTGGPCYNNYTGGRLTLGFPRCTLQRGCGLGDLGGLIDIWVICVLRG